MRSLLHQTTFFFSAWPLKSGLHVGTNFYMGSLVYVYAHFFFFFQWVGGEHRRQNASYFHTTLHLLIFSDIFDSFIMEGPIVGNKAKGRISKWVLQESKACQIFLKTNISYPLICTGRIKVNKYASICLILEAKFGSDLWQRIIDSRRY